MRAIIFGAGAQGRVILDIVKAQARHQCVEFVDDDVTLRGRYINGASVCMGFDEALNLPADVEMIVALGNPFCRMKWVARISERGFPLLSAIHPSAVVMPSACMGKGVMVGANAVINSNAVIGDGVVVNTAAIIEHDCKVADGAAIGPGARLAGRVSLQTCAFIATGAIVNSRLAVGARTVVGAGAVVTRDLPDDVMAFGVPARVRQSLGPDFDWSRVL
jgi:acetyltransferase EpsM